MNKLTALFCLIFFIIAIALFALDMRVQKQTESLILRPPHVSLMNTPYPVLSSEVTPGRNISARSFSILDKDSGVTIFAKNNTTQFPLASTTKIMTALVALEYFTLSDNLVVEDDVVEGTVVGFKKNETVSFLDLLYAMLLTSGNDAAVAIADNYPGGRNAFVQRMNEKAHQLMLKSMHFVDATGLEDEGDYGTSSDLSRLATIALENSTFAKVVSTKVRTIKAKNTGNIYVLTNLNKLLGESGITGVKTGHTEKAGDVLVTSKEENGRTIIIALLKSEDRFADTRSLLQDIHGRISYLSFRSH